MDREIYSNLHLFEAAADRVIARSKPPWTAHPADFDLALYVSGDLSPREAKWIRQHLVTCSRCTADSSRLKQAIASAETQAEALKVVDRAMVRALVAGTKQVALLPVGHAMLNQLAKPQNFEECETFDLAALVKRPREARLDPAAYLVTFTGIRVAARGNAHLIAKAGLNTAIFPTDSSRASDGAFATWSLEGSPRVWTFEAYGYSRGRIRILKAVARDGTRSLKRRDRSA